MTDTYARMRTIVGTTAEWAANDRIIGDGEIALERAGASTRMKVGDGINPFSALAYFDPGIFAFVLKDGDTMTGPLVVPQLSVTGAPPAQFANGISVAAGNSTFGGAVNLGALATAANPASGSDDDTSVATTHWVQQQIGGVISGLNILGSWNAATNTPALASGGAGVPTPTRGDFYIVSVAGTTTLDGISTWAVGDTVVFNGVTWQRVPQTLGYEQVVAGLGYVPVNKAGDTMTGNLHVGTGIHITTADNQVQADWLSARGSGGLDLQNTANAVNQRNWVFTSAAGGGLVIGANTDAWAPQKEWYLNRDGSTTFPGAVTAPNLGRIVRDVTLASPAASIDLFSLGVKSVQVIFNVRLATGGATLGMRSATGSTVLSSATYSSLTSSNHHEALTPAGAIYLSGTSYNLAQIASTGLISGTITIPDISLKRATAQLTYNANGGQWHNMTSSHINDSAAGDGLTIFASSGNLQAGSFVRVIGWP